MALVHAILAVLVDEPCSGYDLRKRFEGSVGFFWKASFQQIYRELTKLEEQGLLEAHSVQQENRPDKKIYSVTTAGREYFQNWIVQSSDISPPKDDLLVKLFAGHLVSRQTILAQLEQHRQQHCEQLAIYEAIAQRYFQNPNTVSIEQKYHFLTLRYGIRYETEWLNWCNEVMDFLKVHIPD